MSNLALVSLVYSYVVMVVCDAPIHACYAVLRDLAM